MAGQMQGPGQGGRGWRSRRYQPLSDINVTPFVDVMLVLLIVFMVTAPLLTVGVPVDLPKAKAQTLSDPDEPLVVSVNAQGALFVQDTEVEIGNLVPRLVAITENKPDTRIFVRGDRSIDYGRVMEVMSTVNSAGFTRVALIAELPSGTSPAEPAADSPDDTESR
ncbi:protein TolR [Denitrobaculum tricleocarpae]|uniref:Protein TolR n=1 Tax=Denitrobaculum tricleocarpae TaxID=2591009 RepID=A0A545TX29_9PROT|nr:protein TolR [Denitrobaculum tricleocarpae]TQV81741.1 protein TolR [Denitrobaculum tricleocarpae]